MAGIVVLHFTRLEAPGMRFVTSLCLALGIFLSTPVNAGIVSFDFDFKDGSGTSIGTGFYTFDDIAPAVKAPFTSLTNFSWGFEILPLGLSLSSVAGDIPSSDFALDVEGILLTGVVGSRTLTFFDDDAVNILHRDVSRAFPSGVNFPDTAPTVAQYYNEGGLILSGSFIARERSASVVPEPASLALFGLGCSGLLLYFGRRKRE